MPTLTPAQIAAVARSAGLTDPGRLATAVAIALGESGGRTDAHNPVGLDDSYGLWQINMRGGQGPERRRALGLTSNAQLFDPATNARAMMMISRQGANFTPWTVFTRGLYLVHLPRARAAVEQLGAASGGGVPPAGGGGGAAAPSDNPLIPDAIEGTAQAAQQAVRLAAGAGTWLSDRHNWLRVSYVLGGGALMVVALLMATQGPVAGAAGKIVGGLIPAGKAVKAAGAVAGKLATRPKVAA